jgi:hypothetical protein
MSVNECVIGYTISALLLIIFRNAFEISLTPSVELILVICCFNAAQSDQINR